MKEVEDSNLNFQIIQFDHQRCLQYQRSQEHTKLYVCWFSYLNNNTYPQYSVLDKDKEYNDFFTLNKLFIN